MKRETDVKEGVKEGVGQEANKLRWSDGVKIEKKLQL